MRSLRAPSKFLFLTTLAACLLAGAGLQRASRESRPGFALPGLGRGHLAARACGRDSREPRAPGEGPRGALPEILDPRALFVIRTAWPAALAVSGILLLGAALASRSRALSPPRGDSPRPRPPPRERPGEPLDRPRVLRPASRGGAARGAGANRRRLALLRVCAGNVPGLRWAEEVARRNSDVWLYYVDRQALVPRTHVIDGLVGAFDEDRAGWAPPGLGPGRPRADPLPLPGAPRPAASGQRALRALVPSPSRRSRSPPRTRRSCPRSSNRCASTRSATPCRGPSGPTASSSWRTGTSCSDACPPRRSTRGRWPSSRLRPIRPRTDRHRPRRGRTRCATSSRTPIRCASSARVRPDGWSFSTVTTPTGGPIRTVTPGRFCGPMADIGRWRPAVAARC